MRVVQILGVGPNLASASLLPDADIWCMNNPRIYGVRGRKDIQARWTAWFNVHASKHYKKRYPAGYAWYTKQDGSKPIYLRDGPDPNIPGSCLFPGPMLQDHFKINETEKETFFTCSLTWLMAFAIYQRYGRIELWGFSLMEQARDTQRPAIHYWIGRARGAGIEVFLPPDVDTCKAEVLYGYDNHPGYNAE